MNTLASFKPKKFYHIFNRTNNKDRLFRSIENRLFFLNKFNSYLGDYTNIYAYVLLDNHFHFSLSTKSNTEIISAIKHKNPAIRTTAMKNFINDESTASSDGKFHDFISSQFMRFFISYSQSFNKMHNRQGSLFSRQFKRSIIDSRSKFISNIYYIHHNARHHGLVDNFKDYRWSSYHSLIGNDKTFLDRDYIMKTFEGRTNFIEYHEQSNLNSDFEVVDID